MLELYTFAEVARMFGRSPDTVYRWTRGEGSRGVVLETTYVGGSPRVTQAALNEFFRRTTAARKHPETHDA